MVFKWCLASPISRNSPFSSAALIMKQCSATQLTSSPPKDTAQLTLWTFGSTLRDDYVV